ncbi:unnamed protein product [Acanthosepion pharaonis]|uniref:Uncharacterized protein n=1 Tax=Acanthosepion pharaonis TaxID=158019 RepID=A0A812C036_ACAPH|nr:unnamed protein product [Sepia pharaonis]
MFVICAPLPLAMFVICAPLPLAMFVICAPLPLAMFVICAPLIPCLLSVPSSLSPCSLSVSPLSLAMFIICAPLLPCSLSVPLSHSCPVCHLCPSLSCPNHYLYPPLSRHVHYVSHFYPVRYLCPPLSLTLFIIEVYTCYMQILLTFFFFISFSPSIFFFLSHSFLSTHIFIFLVSLLFPNYFSLSSFLSPSFYFQLFSLFTFPFSPPPISFHSFCDFLSFFPFYFSLYLLFHSSLDSY